MLQKLITALISDIPCTAPGAAVAPRYEPYTSANANALYNLLFSEDLTAFDWHPGQEPLPWKKILLAMSVDVSAMQELASTLSQEGRVRYSAFSRLRELGNSVPPKILLGVVVEVPQVGGLGVLSVYYEGGVRYINQSGKMLAIDGTTNFLPVIHRLFAASEALVECIGPWGQPRLSPPVQGNVRLSFLVSDGLYFAEGDLSGMEDDALTGPIIERADELLRAITAVGSD